MSLQACVLILIVLAVRPFLKKYPRIYSYGLWILVGARLLCPALIEASFSLQPELLLSSGTAQIQQLPDEIQGSNTGTGEPVQGKDGETYSGTKQQDKPESVSALQPDAVPNTQPDKVQNVQYVSGSVSRSDNPAEPSGTEPAGKESSENRGRSEKEGLYRLFTILYLTGAGIVCCIYLLQFLLVRKRIAAAVRDKENVWYCENISTPFVMGIIRPKIFLPYDLSEQEKYHVLLHERTHIRHHDPLIRFAGLLCICLHWWNPLVWLAVHKMNQDMEMFCDEAALRNATVTERKLYAGALLSFAEKQSGFSVGLAFGESNTERRVRNIMKKRKSSFIIIVLLVLLAVFCIFAFLTVPKESGKDSDIPVISDDEGIQEDNGAGGAENKNENQGGSEKQENSQGQGSEGTEPGSGSITLTEDDLDYLKRLSMLLPDFSEEAEMDAGFWENYLFCTYTSDFERETVNLYSEQYGSEILYVKIDAAEVGRTVEQIFGKTLSEYVKDMQALGDSTDNIKYEDGYFYISISDSPDYVLELKETAAADGVTKVVLLESVDFEPGPIAEITLYLLPAENERGFIITGRASEIFTQGGGNQIQWDKTSIYGTWKITDYIAPWIYALTEEEINSYIGRSIVYTENSICLENEDSKKVERYSREIVTAREFEEMYRASTAELGISGTALNYYEAAVEGDFPFGSSFYQVDYDNALIFYEGVFFRAVREEIQEEETETNVNPPENGAQDGDTKVGREAMLAAYTAVLEGIYFDHVFPDGQECGFDEIFDITQNRFAVFDIDFDGKDELIVEYSDSYVAGMVTKIYGFDSESNTVREEFSGFPVLVYYDNGIIEVWASHNHGRAATLEDFWPYALHQYDPETDSYPVIAVVDAWDKAWAKIDPSSGAAFPEEVDTDGDGVVYYIMKDGKFEYNTPCDFEEYNQWRNSYLGEAERIVVPYSYLTEENIEGLK